MAFISEGQIQALMDSADMDYEEARTLLEMKLNGVSATIDSLYMESPVIFNTDTAQAIDAEHRRELDEDEARRSAKYGGTTADGSRVAFNTVRPPDGPPPGTYRSAADDTRPKFRGDTTNMAASVPNKADPGQKYPARPVEGNRPRCPKHKTRMAYDASEDRMVCTEDGCVMQAKKNYSFQDAVGAMPSERPAIYKGPIKIVFTDEGEPFLYLSDANAMVSIAGVVGDDADPKALSRIVMPLRTADMKRRKAARDADAEVRRRDRRLKAQAERRFKDNRDIANAKFSRPRLYGVEMPPHIGQEEISDLRTAYESTYGEAFLRIRKAYEAEYPTYDPATKEAIYEVYNAVGTLIAHVNSADFTPRGFFSDMKMVFESMHPGTSDHVADAAAYVMAYGMEVTPDNLDMYAKQLVGVLDDMRNLNAGDTDILSPKNL